MAASLQPADIGSNAKMEMKHQQQPPPQTTEATAAPATYFAPSSIPPEVVDKTFSDTAAVKQEANMSSESLGAESPIVEEYEAEIPPPPFGQDYGSLDHSPDGIGTRAVVADDGRVNILINERRQTLSALLVPALRNQLDLIHQPPASYHDPFWSLPNGAPPPALNVVIHVVGSRGDVQPFVALGKVLISKYGHRVRLATHTIFKDFVTDNGLEYFDIGGDPSELMAFMVKNPGLMPGLDTLRRGDVGKRRRDIAEMMRKVWRSCIEAGDGTDIDPSDMEIDDWKSVDGDLQSELPAPLPFVADVIISNPASFAHIHVAEKLGVPLHMMFTMPWSPTKAFPHPLANIQSTTCDPSMTNFMSYALVDMMTWQGLGDVINRFRQKVLNLEPVSQTWAPGMLSRLHIPWTYCWSPALIPKPADWGNYINISGFYFLDLATSYTPDPELAAFLAAGPPPVYIGFGSIVVDDPNGMTRLIFDAVKKSGQRAIVSKGWGGFGAEDLGKPENVYMLGNCPHDWLFKQVSCVVHHGGAGTTATGIAAGRPTVVVPFFGDQPFWGSMVARAGAGPNPVPYKHLTSDALSAAILEALKPESVAKARLLSEKIANEKGTESGAQSFHQSLDLDKMRCVLSPERVAVWRIKRTDIRLSALAANVLGTAGYIQLADLELFRPTEHFTEDEPWDPLTGGASALIGTMGSMTMGLADLPIGALKALKLHHPDHGRSRASSGASRSRSRANSEESLSPSPQPKIPGEEPSRIKNFISHYITHKERRGRSRSHSSSSARSLSSIASSRSGKDGSPTSTAATSPAHTFSEHHGLSKTTSNRTDATAVAYNDLNATVNTGKGLFRIASAGLKSPMDLTLALARGFHNAPKLYHDQTVRQSAKITNFSSGVRAAGKEIRYGLSDGVTGLVTQPINGAKNDGATGLLKGIGKGLGGALLKPGAALFGIPGYTTRGIYKELQKHFGPSFENYIMASRTAQGYHDTEAATPEEKAMIIANWREMSRHITSKPKKKFREEQLEKLHAKYEHAKTRARSATVQSKDMNKTQRRHHDFLSPDDPLYAPVTREEALNILSHANTYEEADAEAPNSPHQQFKIRGFSDRDFENAIQSSVKQTSKGDKEQDAAIERAIRASVVMLEDKATSGADERVLGQAMTRTIEKAKEGVVIASQEIDDIGEDESCKQHGPFGKIMEEADEEDEEFNRAIEKSKELHEQQVLADEKEKEEEQIVLKWIMKQSALEEEFKKQMAAKKAAEKPKGLHGMLSFRSTKDTL